MRCSAIESDDQFAMHQGKRIGQNYQRAPGFSCERCSNGLDVSCTFDRSRDLLHAQVTCRLSEQFKVVAGGNMSGHLGIEHSAGPRGSGHHLLEQLQPLAAHRQFEVGEAGDIAARTRQSSPRNHCQWDQTEFVNTIGMPPAVCLSARTTEVVSPRITSGFQLTSSRTRLRARSSLPRLHRSSI